MHKQELTAFSFLNRSGIFIFDNSMFGRQRIIEFSEFGKQLPASIFKRIIESALDKPALEAGLL
jgi:hypothetical protein